MAITRVKSYFGTSFYGQAPAPSEWAFAPTGGTISMFMSKGSGPHNYAGSLYRVHTFDSIGSNNITFTEGGYIDVLVIAGGGTGGSTYGNAPGGGGGAGGLIQSYQYVVEGGQTYAITVGAGGSNSSTSSDSNNGQDSVFNNLTAVGGGGGGDRYNSDAKSGGSGGGMGDGSGSGASGILGQGFPGGSNNSGYDRGAGGGGAGGAGGDVFSDQDFGYGGIGLAIPFNSDVPIYYAGGGAGSQNGFKGVYHGGLGGGAHPITSNSTYGQHAFYYGGGGSSGSTTSNNWYRGGNGYQGVVMVRYVIP